MLGKQHLIYGITTATAVALFVYPHPVSLIAGAAIGSVFPDIDTPNSGIGRQLPILSNLINKAIGHRTYVHDPALWIPLGIALSIQYPWLWGFFSGIWSHLFLDSLTAGGIPVCYFFHKKRFHLLPHWLKFNSSDFAAEIVTAIFCLLTFLGIGFFPMGLKYILSLTNTNQIVQNVSCLIKNTFL